MESASISTESEIKSLRMSNIMLNQCTRNGIAVTVSSNSVTILGEEANVVAFGAYGNGPSNLLLN